MIQRVLAPNPGPMTLTGTNTYLVSDSAGNVGVIDPGPDEPRHLAAIVAAANRIGPITAVLVTHHHLDHLPAAAPLCARSGATLIGHAQLPGVQRPAADDEVVFDGWRALETPGHTRDSLCFWEPTTGSLFTGDLVAGSGTVVLDDQPGALADYLGSLERLLERTPRTIYPGHGPTVDDAMARLHEYLDHRRKRVEQVLDALRARGSATVDELVFTIYTDVAPNLAPMAARNVRANLELLAAQDQVRPAGDRWRLTRT